MADIKSEDSNSCEADCCVEEMPSSLKKQKDYVIAEVPSTSTVGTTKKRESRSAVVPDEFRCPISLELMQNPVIMVSSSQTYERSCIQSWLDSGHNTCPKTQLPLSDYALKPNFVLKDVIAEWCEANGIDLPNNKVNSLDMKAAKSCHHDRIGLVSIMNRLCCGNQDEQRAAACDLRLLARRNTNNRICIAEAGAIPWLINLLSSSDPRTQEHAITALLNLSIHDNNTEIVVGSHAIPKVVQVLKTGSMEARENAAATLFALSVKDDEHKITIGTAGAIPPLVNLLGDGRTRGKKDAATALFSLCIYFENRIRAVKAGIVTHLMKFLVDPSGVMVDEALALLAILATSEGWAVIAQAEPIPKLVEVIKSGSPRNSENAAAIIWSLCCADVGQARAAKAAGAEDALKKLSQSGTDRAKRKASSILEVMHQGE
ncbi:unnamed protein product [Urochloa humidicola]